MLRRYASAFPRSTPPWAYALLAVVAVGWAYVVPNFWVFLGGAACLLAIASLGLTVVIGWAGEVSLAQASLVGTSVYLTGYAARHDGWGWPLIPAMVVGVLAATLLSTLVALPTAKLSGIYVMVLTLGMQVAIERTIFTNAKLTGGPDGVFMGRPHLLGISFESDRSYYFLCLAVLALVIVVLSLFRASRHGRAMLLVRTDRRAAGAVGISPWKYKIIAFAFGGLLAGLAGGLTAPLYRSPPTLLQYLSIPSLLYVAVPVTAGFESLLAVVGVAFVFTMVPQATQGWGLSPFVVAGFGLLAGTFVGSRGLGGLVLDGLRRRGGRRATTAPAARRTVVTGRVVREEPPVRRALVLSAANGNGHAPVASNGNGNGHADVLGNAHSNGNGNGHNPGADTVTDRPVRVRPLVVRPRDERVAEPVGAPRPEIRLSPRPPSGKERRNGTH